MTILYNTGYHTNISSLLPVYCSSKQLKSRYKSLIEIVGNGSLVIFRKNEGQLAKN